MLCQLLDPGPSEISARSGGPMMEVGRSPSLGDFNTGEKEKRSC
jgi:hypothetical protein